MTETTSLSLNLQDLFLTQVCEEKIPVVIYLMNGFQIRGLIQEFDSFTILVVSEQKQQLVYKHAVSTISPAGPEADGVVL